MAGTGWHRRILWVDLSRGKSWVEEYPESMAHEYLGGRGYAIRILWDRLEPGTDPLSPENIIVYAIGPLTGLPLPSSGKMVIASKSPLTGGYGDGNIGTRAAVHLRKAGYDALAVTGRAEKPVYLYIDEKGAEIHSAEDLWGLDAEEVDNELGKRHGRRSGILTIGPAGERLVRYAVVMSEKDRAGGRPGMGAVMGSKNLKAIVIHGEGEIPAKDPDKVKEIGKQAYSDVKNAENYQHWMSEGTMAILMWCQEMSVLPTYNFREGVFDGAEKVSGEIMAREYKVFQKGCPQCNMVCGNVGEAKTGPFAGTRAELDYENVEMLGPNLGIDSLDEIIGLVRMADNMGFDTISLGSVLGFATEAYEKGLITKEDLDGIEPRWGETETYVDLINLILERKKFGNTLAKGTKLAALKLGNGAIGFAMQVKGLEASAYDAHIAHGMALAFGTSPIGAHHKDAWYIYREALRGFDVNDRQKVEEIINLQRIRGGLFETFVTCRFPFVEVGLNLDYYPRLLEAATGLSYTMNQLFNMADKIYDLIRLFWVREYGWWDRSMDTPPARWFDEPLTKGPRKGAHLDRKIYNQLLDWYYEIRGWDERGIPRRSTLEARRLGREAREIESMGIKLSP